ncbi:porin [Nostoc linckia FACHB-104]|nr:porin [Nostoc linckia FACHB-104]
MHKIKILSCGLLFLADPNLSYASEGGTSSYPLEAITEEVPQARSLFSTEAKDLQGQVPLIAFPDIALEKLQKQRSPTNTQLTQDCQLEIGRGSRGSRGAEGESYSNIFPAGLCLSSSQAGDDANFLWLTSSDSTQDVQPKVQLSPLQSPPTQLHNLETANQLRQGAVQLEGGFLQVLPTDNSVSGTGLQTYQLAIDWGITDNFQIGFTGDIFDDYLKCPVRSECTYFTTVSYGTKLKYQIINQNRWAVGVAGTFQLLNISANAGVFNNSPNKQFVVVTPVGALQLPITYKASPNLQLHFTPGVVFFPEKVADGDFFGTFFNIGTGFSWQTSRRVNLFANIQTPLGPGGNTFIAKDRSIARKLVWTVGIDYALNPKMGAEVYATNSYGATPTTGLLSFIPDGDDFLLGVRFKHAIDFGQGYAANFSNTPPTTLYYRDGFAGRRQRTLLFDGLTLSTPNTLPTGNFRFRGGLGTHGGSSFALAYGLTDDSQLELSVDQFASSDRFSEQDISGTGIKIGGAMKLKFFDQARGDGVTLSAKLAGISETQLQSGGLNGTLYVELPISYQLNSQTTISINPKGAFFGSNRRIGVGIGINQAIADWLQLIGEFTPVLDGKRSTWATGLRFLPSSRFGLDIFATNTIGQSGLGTLNAEPDGTNFGFSLIWGI